MKLLPDLYTSALLAAILFLCFAPSLGEIPPRPYSAVWNSPTTQCFGSSLDLSKFNIIQNQNDAINGGNITTFDDIGQFPVWGTVNMSIVNGGIPQLGNLSLHLDLVKRDINSIIPDADFVGLAVIDFQSWRPLYRQNFDELGVYQRQSIAYARKKHPNMNASQLEEIAEKEFDEAARSFLEGTLKLAQKLRPRGLWGYLGYPYCKGVLGYYCDDMGVEENKMIQWLFDASSALYPTLFIGQYQTGSEVIDLVSVIHESHRIIANRTSPLYLYLYTRYTYSDNPAKFYKKEEIDQGTFFASAFGVDGVVVMGTTTHTTSKSLCNNLLQFIEKTYGPATKSAYDWALSCSNSMCQAHGQCVDISEGIPSALKQTLQKNSCNGVDKIMWNPMLYKCRCYPGWQGEECQMPVAH